MKDKKKSNNITSLSDDSENDGIIGMLISMHTFPIESEDELIQKQKMIEDLKDMSDQIINE